MFGLFTRPVELTPAKKSEPEPEQPSSPAFSSRGENEEGVEYTLFGLDGTENEYDQMMKKHMASVDGAASGVDEIGFEDDRECDEEEEANDDNAHRDVEVEEPENENDNDNDNEFQMPNYNIR